MIKARQNKSAQTAKTHNIKRIQNFLLHLSQAAACDGTKITTSAEGQGIPPVTLPIY